MTGTTLALGGFAAMLVLIALRVPVGLSMLAVGAVGYLYAHPSGWIAFVGYMKTNPYHQFANYTLSVIPLFILMGALAERSGMNDRVVIGIIDDDIHLKGRIVAGLHVLGGVEEIAGIVTEHRIDGVIITCLMDKQKQARVAKQLEKMGVLVSVWACEENVLSDPNSRMDEKKAK